MTAVRSEKTISVKFSCNIQGDLKSLYLIFSINNGTSWYRVKMKNVNDKYAVLVPNIEVGTRILYVFKAIAPNGQEILDNNNGKFYSQIAGNKSSILKPQKSTESSPNLSSSVQSDQVENETSQEKEKPISKEPKKNISNNSNLPPEFMHKNNPFLSDSVSSFPEPNNSQKASSKQNSSTSPEELHGTVENQSSSSISSKTSINSDKFAPIIPLNPFPADYGDIEVKSDPLTLFSEIIDDQISNTNSSMAPLTSSEVENNKKCSNCGANLNVKWNRCPFCGR